MIRKVVKRNGDIVDFDFTKIKTAIEKAYKSCSKKAGRKAVYSVKGILENEYDEDRPVPVEEIQNLVESEIAKYDFDVAKAYILYREHHNVVRDWVDKKIAFIESYKKSNNNADATVDDNSNVGSKNVGVMNNESHKSDNIEISRGIITRKLAELYPNFDAKQYVRDLESHIIYKHDESAFSNPVPYTYSSKEVVEAKYYGKSLLIPLDMLYDIVEEQEKCVDEENVVFQKIPWHLYLKDRNNNWIKATHITKKERHRPLVRIKTAFGEDLVVTDNHPMIVDSENIENTIKAKDCEGYNQFKVNTKLKFIGKETIDFKQILPSWIDCQENYIKIRQTITKRFINADRSLGYLIGFFVGDGNFDNSSKRIHYTQKDKAVLEKLNNEFFRIFGCVGNINKESNHDKYILDICNPFIYELFRNYFKIQDKAQNKTLPYNVLEFNEPFAIGLLEGLIDSDGTVSKESISIRLSSRACVLQATQLFRHFGYSIGNTIQSVPFSNNTSYNTNYTIWGITATPHSGSVLFDESEKARNIQVDIDKSAKYKPYGEAKITSVCEIEPESAFYGQNEFIYDVTTESHTFCCNNILAHNCVSITMYPFLTDGIKSLGGLSASPKNLDSFCGIFCNLIHAISGQFAGAVAASEFLLYFTYFAKKEWGDDFYLRPDTVITQNTSRELTIEKQIEQYFQQIVYTINQPVGSRGLQSVFFNVSYFDKNFFEGMFGDFAFPDFTKPDWESLNWIQRKFMTWFNEERLKCILTFPVESFALVYKDGHFLDQESADFVAEEYAKGHSFFTYISDTVDSLSSCCRLRNMLTTKEFNFTNGNMGVQTGSKSVITLNLNRITQDFYKTEYSDELRSHFGEGKNWMHFKELFGKYMNDILERVFRYHVAYNELLWDMKNAHLLTVYDAGFIDLNKQYLTIGLNGLNQAAEFLSIECTNNEDYKNFCKFVFSTISEFCNTHKGKQFGHQVTLNVEMVPAESLAIKNYNWDKEDGYFVGDDTNLYASYVFKPNDEHLSILDKIIMHSKQFAAEELSGGQAAHLNLDTHLTKEQYQKILDYAGKVGCNYFTFNVPNSQCDDCGFITKVPIDKCPKCGSENISYYDRIIGYLTRIKNWSAGRQIEQKTRVYQKVDI